MVFHTQNWWFQTVDLIHMLNKRIHLVDLKCVKRQRYQAQLNGRQTLLVDNKSVLLLVHAEMQHCLSTNYTQVLNGVQKT